MKKQYLTPEIELQEFQVEESIAMTPSSVPFAHAIEDFDFDPVVADLD